MLQVPVVVDDKSKVTRSKSINSTSTEMEDPSSADENTNLHGNSLYELTAKCLDDLLKTMIDRDATNETLSNIYKHLEPWLTSVHDHERLRSIRSLASVLKHFASIKYSLNVFKDSEKEVNIKKNFDHRG